MTSNTVHKSIGVIAILLFAAVAGCSRGPVTYTVMGTVTLDGNPVTNGYVIFSPVQGSVSSAVSGEVQNGNYTLKCLPGDQKVMITGQMSNGSIVPLRYIEEGSDLTAAIDEDNTTVNFELTSKVKRRR